MGGNGPFRFLFEGQDSRAFSNDEPGDFRTTQTVNQFDILQLLGSLTINNVGGSGLRTDLHVGRMTMDFGMRRYVARNDFRNTTNAFDGVHWQIGEGQTWRFRAFLVEPVIRDDVQLDKQTAKSVFWGTYVESAHVPWFNVNAYYFGLNDQQLLSKIKLLTVRIVRTVFACSSLPRPTNSIMNSRGPFKRDTWATSSILPITQTLKPGIRLICLGLRGFWRSIPMPAAVALQEEARTETLISCSAPVILI